MNRPRYAVAILVTAVAVLIAVAVVAVAAHKPDAGVERIFPTYWNELEEGELTRAELTRRLGPPDRRAGSCLFYDHLVVDTRYRFCFRDGVLNLKAAY